VGVAKHFSARHRFHITLLLPSQPSPVKLALGRAQARPGWGEETLSNAKTANFGLTQILS
jgi:hypothetical protein